MGLARVYCRAQQGVDAPEVSVEVHLAGGLPAMSIVGLPETAVKESKDRVKAALQTAGFEVPPRRVTISLAPADLPKEGGRYDLPIALGILAASGQLPAGRLVDHEFVGELGLSGELRSIRGALPVAIACRNAGRRLVVPPSNADEAALAGDAQILTGDGLLAVCRYLKQGDGLEAVRSRVRQARPEYPDLREVRGQHQARRALEVAAAGGHNLLLFGPPGTGKTMLAQRLPGMLPPLEESEALEAASVLSISGAAIEPERWRQRPFRAPHHTASAVALVGGGSNPRPGEISLAHRGVLFLDELPEFDRRVLDVLREPLESGRIVISRAARQAEYPARFQLVAAMNPCPCGYHGSPESRCRCAPGQISRYRQRVSGPLLDRIDLHVRVPRQSPRELRSTLEGESSEVVRDRVSRARARQRERQGCVNAALDVSALQQHCRLHDRDRALVERACERLGLSARAYHRILKLARSIADLAEAPEIKSEHLTEAIQYRRVDVRSCAGSRIDAPMGVN